MVVVSTEFAGNTGTRSWMMISRAKVGKYASYHGVAATPSYMYFSTKLKKEMSESESAVHSLHDADVIS